MPEAISQQISDPFVKEESEVRSLSRGSTIRTKHLFFPHKLKRNLPKFLIVNTMIGINRRPENFHPEDGQSGCHKYHGIDFIFRLRPSTI